MRKHIIYFVITLQFGSWLLPSSQSLKSSAMNQTACKALIYDQALRNLQQAEAAIVNNPTHVLAKNLYEQACRQEAQAQNAQYFAEETLHDLKKYTKKYNALFPKTPKETSFSQTQLNFDIATKNYNKSKLVMQQREYAKNRSINKKDYNAYRQAYNQFLHARDHLPRVRIELLIPERNPHTQNQTHTSKRSAMDAEPTQATTQYTSSNIESQFVKKNDLNRNEEWEIIDLDAKLNSTTNFNYFDVDAFEAAFADASS